MFLRSKKRQIEKLGIFRAFEAFLKKNELGYEQRLKNSLN